MQGRRVAVMAAISFTLLRKVSISLLLFTIYFIVRINKYAEYGH